jgi:NADH-quinone oxidoreductase subunit N
LLIFKQQKHQKPEFYFLMLAVLAGSLFMVNSNHFLLLYISIELASYGSYFLTGFRFTKHASEASFKYLLFGGVSSGIMLFGISLLYGSGFTMQLDSIASTPLSQVGIAMFMAGVLFKTSIVPFHIWTPSTYQIAPTDAVAFFSIVPKLAGFGLLYHVVSGLPADLSATMVPMLILLSIISIIWGTFSAIPQKDVKRLISYGAIAHSGFILPLCLMDNENGLSAFSYYTIIYAIMNLAIFFFVQLHEKRGNIRLMDLAGLGKRFPLIGVLSVIMVIALVGLPPTAGFIAKLFLFSTAWLTYQDTQLTIWLVFVVVGILSSAVSLYFYLRIPFFYFFQKDRGYEFKFRKHHIMLLTFFAIVLLYLFIQPEILDSFAIMPKP